MYRDTCGCMGFRVCVPLRGLKGEYVGMHMDVAGLGLMLLGFTAGRYRLITTVPFVSPPPTNNDLTGYWSVNAGPYMFRLHRLYWVRVEPNLHCSVASFC